MGIDIISVFNPPKEKEVLNSDKKRIQNEFYNSAANYQIMSVIIMVAPPLIVEVGVIMED